jgi:methylated-DNA-protein-cysteine methyltransferase-like protein
MTYGQIAELLGHTISARAVGWAMHVCPEDVPWQRVVNAAGRCSTNGLGDLPQGLQRALLEAEDVVFRLDGSLDLARYRHRPRPRRVRMRS